jgi:SMI1-KNR4 cell-wall
MRDRSKILFGNRFKKNPPATHSEIRNVEMSLGCSFPESYSDFLMEANGGFGCIGKDGYVDIWPIELVAERRVSYQFDRYLPNCIPVGSDGGDEALVIRFVGNSVSFGYVPFMNLKDEYYKEIEVDFWNVLEIIGEGSDI